VPRLVFIGEGKIQRAPRGASADLGAVHWSFAASMGYEPWFSWLFRRP